MHWLHTFSHGVAFHEGSHVLSASWRATTRDNVVQIEMSSAHAEDPHLRKWRYASLPFFQVYFPNPISLDSENLAQPEDSYRPVFHTNKLPQKWLIHLFNWVHVVPWYTCGMPMVTSPPLFQVFTSSSINTCRPWTVSRSAFCRRSFTIDAWISWRNMTCLSGGKVNHEIGIYIYIIYVYMYEYETLAHNSAFSGLNFGFVTVLILRVWGFSML